MDLVAVVVALGVAVPGVLLVRRGRRFLRDDAHFVAGARRAPAEVVEVRYVREHRESPGLQFPVVRFTTSWGRPVETQVLYGHTPAAAQPGDRVTVLYDPAAPERASLEGVAGGRLLGWALVAVGCSTAATALLLGLVVLAV